MSRNVVWVLEERYTCYNYFYWETKLISLSRSRLEDAASNYPPAFIESGKVRIVSRWLY